MSKQTRNLVESVIPGDCPVAPFIAFVRQYGSQEGRVDAPENALFGEGFAPQERNPKPKKSDKNEAIGVRMFLEFVRVQKKKKVWWMRSSTG